MTSVFFEGLNQKKKFFQLTPNYYGKIETAFGRFYFGGFAHFSRRSFLASHSLDFQLPGKSSFFSFNLKEDVAPWGRTTVFSKAININEIPIIKERLAKNFKSFTIQQFSSLTSIMPNATDFSWQSREIPLGRYVYFSSTGYYSRRGYQPDYFRSNFMFRRKDSETFIFGSEMDWHGSNRSFKFILRHTL